MKDDEFRGDKKLPMTSLLAKPERAFIDKYVPKFPRWIEGYHLTLTTILWSGGVLLFGYLAGSRNNLHWLWCSSLMLFCHWFSDSFDGSLGRYRDTGIPKWGYYMDHFLDFVFMACVVIGYAFLFEGTARFLMLIFAFLYGTLMASAFLAFAATSEFKITYLGIGGTETRLLLVLLNIALIVFGARWLEMVLPYALAVFSLLMCVVVFRTQKYIWNVDMEDKQARSKPDGGTGQ